MRGVFRRWTVRRVLWRRLLGGGATTAVDVTQFRVRGLLNRRSVARFAEFWAALQNRESNGERE